MQDNFKKSAEKEPYHFQNDPRLSAREKWFLAGMVGPFTREDIDVFLEPLPLQEVVRPSRVGSKPTKG